MKDKKQTCEEEERCSLMQEGELASWGLVQGRKEEDATAPKTHPHREKQGRRE